MLPYKVQLQIQIIKSTLIRKSRGGRGRGVERLHREELSPSWISLGSKTNRYILLAANTPLCNRKGLEQEPLVYEVFSDSK